MYSQNSDYYFGKSFSNDSELHEALNSLAGTKYDSLILKQIINDRLNNEKSLNRLFSTIKIMDISKSHRSDSLFLNFNIFLNKEEEVIIDSIRFSGNEFTKHETLLRELRKNKKPYNYEDIKDLEYFLNFSPYLEKINDITIYKDKSNHYIAEFDVKENQTAFINGIFGYNPNDDKNTFSSDIEFILQNINGTGRAIELNWQKRSVKSNHLKVSYLEPWIFTLPINQKFEIQYDLKDSIYNQIKFNSKSIYKLNKNLSFELGFGIKSIIPVDSITSNKYVTAIKEENSILFGLSYNNLDRKLNSRNGVNLSINYFYLFVEQNKPEWLIERYSLLKTYRSHYLESSFDYFKEIYTNSVLYFHFDHYYKPNTNSSESDFLYFGGSNKLRGFREDQFKSLKAYFFNFEYRFILSDYSRLFVFSDYSIFEKYTIQGQYEKRNGIGIGLRFDSKIGIIGLDYGFESDKLFQDGKIHFGIYGTID